jgi:hypothetical protein
MSSKPVTPLYIHAGDFSASTFLRLCHPARRLAKLEQSSLFLTESRLFPKHYDYLRNGIFIVQRLGGQENLDLMKMFRGGSLANNYKMIYDVDDLLTEANALAGGYEGDGLPEFNNAGLLLDRVKAAINVETMFQFNIVTVSTETLKNSLLDRGARDVRVVPNRLERTVWDIGDKPRTPRSKPRVVYNGGMSHWRESVMLPNGMRLKEHPGDFEGWIEFLVKWIGNNWIEFHFIGDYLPYFLKDVESQVVKHSSQPYMDYSLLMKEIDADFVLCPLAENKFNRCKSDLKCLEAAALNSVPFGSVFGDNVLNGGPYFKWDKGSMIKEAAGIEDAFRKLMSIDGYASVSEKIMKMKKDIWLDDEFIVKTLKPAWNIP